MSPPGELPETLAALVDVLENLKLRYALGGAIAQNFWGTIRATQDIDVLVMLPRVRFQEAADALARAGFTMKGQDGRALPVSVERMVSEEASRRVFAIHRGGVKVEVFLPFLPLQHSILRRAVRMPLGAQSAAVTTAEDMILLKLVFDREKDRRDIRGILWSQKERLDLAYLRDGARKLLAAERIEAFEAMVRRYVEGGQP